MSLKQKRTLRLIVVILMLISAFSAAYWNLFDQAEQDFFDDFEAYSEELIETRILYESKGGVTRFGGIDRTKGLSGYGSNYCLQGRVFSNLYNEHGFSDFGLLNLLCSLAFAVTITVLCWLLIKRYGKLFGATFYIVTLLSPWAVSMAKNTYWVEFLMFLPTALALLMMNTQQKSRQWFWWVLPLYGVSLIRFLCGYEFTSTIMLLAVAFPFVQWVQALRGKTASLPRGRNVKHSSFWLLLAVSFALLAGFATALVIHAGIRGNTIPEGIKAIWEGDVLRRTFGGNLYNVNNSTFDSLVATPLETVAKYLFTWKTSVLAGMPDLKLPMLLILSLVGLYVVEKERKGLSETGLLYIFLTVTGVSWLILGNGHSYVHTHINFVVLYFGMIQIWCYCILRGAWHLARPLLDKLKAKLPWSYREAMLASLTALVLVIGGSVMTISFCKTLHSVKLLQTVEAEGRVVYTDGNETAYFINNNVIIKTEKGSDLCGDSYYLVVTPWDREFLPDKYKEDGFIRYAWKAGPRMLDLPFWYPFDAERREIEHFSVKSIEIGKLRNNKLVWKGIYTAQANEYPDFVANELPNILVQ